MPGPLRRVSAVVRPSRMIASSCWGISGGYLGLSWRPDFFGRSGATTRPDGRSTLPEWRHGKAISPSQIARLFLPFGVTPAPSGRASYGKGLQASLVRGCLRSLPPEIDVTPSRVADLAAPRPDSSRHNPMDVTSEISSKAAETVRCDVVTGGDGSTGVGCLPRARRCRRHPSRWLSMGRTPVAGRNPPSAPTR